MENNMNETTNQTEDLEKLLDSIDQNVGDGTISDQQMKEVQDFLIENEGPDTKLMKEIQEAHAGEDNSQFPLEEGVASVIVDPITGMGSIVSEDNTIETGVNIDNIDDENLMEELTDDAITTTLKNDYSLNENDALQLLKMVKRYQNGEKFGLFNELPEVFKDQLLKALNINKSRSYAMMKELNACAKLLVDEIVSSSNMNQIMLDFDETLKNELNIPSLSDMYSGYLREAIEDELATKAEAIKDTNPDQYFKMTSMIEGFKDSYKLTSMKEILTAEGNNSVRTKIYRLGIYKRLVDEYKRKVSKSKFKFYNVEDIIDVIVSFCNTTEDTAKRLVMLYCSMCRDKDIENDLKYSSYMYYFVRNIKGLAVTDPDKITDFSTELIDNLCEVISLIEDFCTKHEQDINKGGKKNARYN